MLKRLLLTSLFLTSFLSIGLTYDQVSIEKIIPLVLRKSDPTVLRLDNKNRFWLLDTKSDSLLRISEKGTIQETLIGEKNKDSMFFRPSNFIFTQDNELLVMDEGRNEIVFIQLVFSDGSDRAELKINRRMPVLNPSGLALSRDKAIAVGNLKTRQIDVYSFEGLLLHSFQPPREHVLRSIDSLDFGPDGVLWVLDGKSGLIHRFSPNRKHLGATQGADNARQIIVDRFGYGYITLKEGRWKEINNEGKISGTFGTKGKNPGQLMYPFGCTIDKNGVFWVAETENPRLQGFMVKSKEKVTPIIPSPAVRLHIKEIGQWNESYDAATISNKNVFLLAKLKKNTLTMRHVDGKDPRTLILKGRDLLGVSKFGGITVTREDKIWISDLGEHRLKMMDFEGKIHLIKGEKGKREGQFKKPEEISVRDDGSFVVLDQNRKRIQVLNSDGLFQFTVGKRGKEKGELNEVTDLEVSKKRIIVFDNKRKALIFFDDSGKFVNEIANSEKATVWTNVTDLSIDKNERLYVNDPGAGRIRIFSDEGRFIADIFTSAQEIAAGGDGYLLLLDKKATRLLRLEYVPDQVQDFVVEDDAGYMKLTWNSHSDAVRYQVFRSTDASRYYPLKAIEKTSLHDSSVIPGKEYQYAVAGLSFSGYEGQWNVSSNVKAGRRGDVSLISIEEVQLEPVFTAAHKFYVDHPVGKVTIVNNDNKTYRNVKVSLSLKKYTDYPTEKLIKVINSGEELTIPLTMTFNDRVLELTENTPLQTDLRVIFYENTTEKIISQNAPLMLYSRNAISWEDKGRISSFITPRDKPVVEFSRAAIRSFLLPLKSATIGKPFAKVLLFYEALNALNIAYVPDPKTPYAEAAGKPDVLDYVQYPRETLVSKVGDCDDTTALLSSLLESIGVETTLVETPGHIFLMANMEESDPDLLGFPKSRFVEYRGQLWLPVETTKLGKSFEEAWQTASNLVQTHMEKGEVGFISVLDASKSYPPVTLLEEQSEKTIFPEKKVEKPFLDQLKKFEGERYNRRVELVREKIRKNPNDPMLHIELGMVHVEGGKEADGKSIFESFLDHKSVMVQAAAHNNLGNMDYMNKEYDEALKHYQDAAVLDPEDGGILINQARVAVKKGDKEGAKVNLKDAARIFENWREFVGDFPAEYIP